MATAFDEEIHCGDRCEKGDSHRGYG